MKPEQFQREKDYGAGSAIAGRLLKRRLISPDEHSKLMAALIKKHRPAIAILKDSAVIPTYTADTPRKLGVP